MLTGTAAAITTSSPCTEHPSPVAPIAVITASAAAQAAPMPSVNRTAAASAPRSAAACARCRATVATPKCVIANVVASRTASMAAASTLAAPCSPSRLRDSDRFGAQPKTRQPRNTDNDGGHHEFAVVPNPDRGTLGCDAGGDPLRRNITARCQSRSLSGGVHTPDLARHRADPREADHQHRHQSGKGQRRLDGGET